jgi:hypothetical protein
MIKTARIVAVSSGNFTIEGFNKSAVPAKTKTRAVMK